MATIQSIAARCRKYHWTSKTAITDVLRCNGMGGRGIGERVPAVQAEIDRQAQIARARVARPDIDVAPGRMLRLSAAYRTAHDWIDRMLRNCAPSSLWYPIALPDGRYVLREQTEERDWSYYSRSWHRAHGPKITISARRVVIYRMATLAEFVRGVARNKWIVDAEARLDSWSAANIRAAYKSLGLDIEAPRTRSQITRTGYKIVARTDDGQLESVWDRSGWSVGVWRTERASDNHSGGFYYYRTADEAIAAVNANEVFGDSGREAGKTLVLARVEVRGRDYQLSATNKHCATYMRVIEVVREITLTNPQEQAA